MDREKERVTEGFRGERWRKEREIREKEADSEEDRPREEMTVKGSKRRVLP